MKQILSLISIVATLFAGVLCAIAQEKEFPEHNFAITLPDGWHWLTDVPAQKGLCGTMANTNKTRIVALVVDKNDRPNGPLNDQAIAEIEKGIQASGGGTPLSGKFIQIAGIKSYERLGQLTVKGRTMSTFVHMVPTADSYYDIEAIRVGGDASEDPEIRVALDSFRFLSPPKPPDQARAMGYLIGRLTFVVGIIVGMGVVVFSVIATIVRRNKAAPQQKPPPVPPNNPR